MEQNRSPGPKTKRGEEKVSNYWEERIKLNYLQMSGGWMRNRPFFKDDFWRKKRYLIWVGQDALSQLQKMSKPQKHYPFIERIIGRIIDIQNAELWIKQFEARKGKQRTCKRIPKIVISRDSAEMDKLAEEFFGKAALLLGRESIIELKKGRKDLKIGESKFEETQTPEGKTMFTFIQE